MADFKRYALPSINNPALKGHGIKPLAYNRLLFHTEGLDPPEQIGSLWVSTIKREAIIARMIMTITSISG